MDRRDLLKTAALVLGTSVSSACSRALLSGAPLDGAPSRAMLDDVELHKVSVIAELIIPETDTPGAIAAGVPAFIHRIVAEWHTEEERNRFMLGLRTVDEVARERFGADFLGVEHAQQVNVLQTLEAASRGGRDPFFGAIKELTVLGYYTSEIGSQHELVYRPVPGAYQGHAHVSGDFRQWTQ
jgi:hypothetical protein